MLYEIAHKFDVTGLMTLALSQMYQLLENEESLWRRKFQYLSEGYVVMAKSLENTHISELLAFRLNFLCVTARHAARHAVIEPISKLVDENLPIAQHWLRHLAVQTHYDKYHDIECRGSCMCPRKPVRSEVLKPAGSF